MGLDDKRFLEAFNNILPSWVTIFTSSSPYFPEEICKSASMQIFDTYTKSNISPPHGTKTIASVEFDENEEDDRISNQEQLKFIGIFGRLVSMKFI